MKNGAAPGVLIGVRGESRSDENAILVPSGDQAGRKSPLDPSVRFDSVFVLMSSSQMFAAPSRVDTNASHAPFGDSTPWSSNAGLSVKRSRPEPSACTR